MNYQGGTMEVCDENRYIAWKGLIRPLGIEIAC